MGSELLENKLDQLLEKLGGFNNFERYFDAKFDTMKKNCFSDVNRRLDNVEERLDKVEGRLGNIEGKLDQLLAK